MSQYVLLSHGLRANEIESAKKFANFVTLFQIVEPRVNRSRKVLKIWYIFSNHVYSEGSSTVLKDTSLSLGSFFTCMLYKLWSASPITWLRERVINIKTGCLR